MLTKLSKFIVDLTYGVNRTKKNYLRSYPGTTILAADGAKGIRASEEKEIEIGIPWVGAKRAVILLTDKSIVCGDWYIALDTIERAQLLTISSLLGRGQVLKIQTADHQHYQFGMQYNPEWSNQHALPLTEGEAKVRVSAFSWVVRAIAVGYLAYWFLQRFGLL